MFDPLILNTTTSDSYKIKVGYNIFNEAISFIESEYSTQKVLVLIDENVNSLHGETIFGELDTVFETVVKHIIPAGEKSKCIVEYSRNGRFSWVCSRFCTTRYSTYSYTNHSFGDGR